MQQWFYLFTLLPFYLYKAGVSPLNYRSGEPLGLVAQRRRVGIGIAVTQHYAHAAAHVLLLLAEDAQPRIVFFQNVEHIILRFAVGLLLGQHDSTRPCVLKVYGRDWQPHDGAEVQLELV